MSPDLLRLQAECCAGLCLNVVITDPHPVAYSVICDEAYRFGGFVVDEMKLLLI